MMGYEIFRMIIISPKKKKTPDLSRLMRATTATKRRIVLEIPKQTSGTQSIRTYF